MRNLRLFSSGLKFISADQCFACDFYLAAAGRNTAPREVQLSFQLPRAARIVSI